MKRSKRLYWRLTRTDDLGQTKTTEVTDDELVGRLKNAPRQTLAMLLAIQRGNDTEVDLEREDTDGVHDRVMVPFLME